MWAGFTFCFQLLLLVQKILASDNSPSLDKAALIVVDFQNDFCAGGSLPAPGADHLIPVINNIRSKLKFAKVIFTMDWHPPGHISFYERFNNSEKFPGAKLREDYTFDLGDGRGRRTQHLWPVHCVQNTTGAALRAGLDIRPTDVKVFKGTNPDVDSYSAFLDNDGTSETELDTILKKDGIQEIYVTGLAFEFCVGNTAIDGSKKGYKVTILKDATGYFGDPDLKRDMEKKLNAANARIISTEKLLNSGIMGATPYSILTFLLFVTKFIVNIFIDIN